MLPESQCLHTKTLMPLVAANSSASPELRAIEFWVEDQAFKHMPKAMMAPPLVDNLLFAQPPQSESTNTSTRPLSSSTLLWRIAGLPAKYLHNFFMRDKYPPVG